MATKKKKETLKVLEISRSKWSRGSAASATITNALVMPNTKHMCCLGFLGKSCGISMKAMTDVIYPESHAYKHSAQAKKWPEGVLDENEDVSSHLINSWWTEKAIDYNDDEMLAKDRERVLKEHFKDIGYKVVFVP